MFNGSTFVAGAIDWMSFQMHRKVSQTNASSLSSLSYCVSDSSELLCAVTLLNSNDAFQLHENAKWNTLEISFRWALKIKN